MSGTVWLPALFAKFYNAIWNNGTPVPQRPVTNFIGCTVTDDPVLLVTNVTPPNSGATPVVPMTTQSGSFGVSSPSTDLVIPTDSSGGLVTLTVTGTPSPGVRITVIDAIQTWTIHAFKFVSQAGGVVRDPAALGSSDGGHVTVNELAGGAVTWQWCPNVGGGSWLVV